MKVKDLMIPVEEYLTIGKDATLGQAILVLDESQHRDLIVVNTKGDFAGVLTMTDILAALEPSYKRLAGKGLGTDTLSKQYVADAFKEFGLWANPLETLCKEGCRQGVSQVMHIPSEIDFLNEDDTLAYGIHCYIVGKHQPLIVRKNGNISGVLRLSDIYNEVKSRMLACACQ
ncbi:CBS domain-containing protein [Pseudodesulfovibrio piezophilus]|uniref:CBS domain containing membrane protein n=1 Tax=Pseudodesulfovibrio piezophilus (strain DSM 21447 / JCM 15486 / C1TLV30) TaxID=1322246 RepID=M1WNK8_PSEP2|nr:CBS domain-containing protein [Pseudodesulfovibrio piezophilus]CCH50400.1 CBS domain containing membrane protein [Pseudodesulfovibrio piezophilus C1TLV30]